jgi:hypothetical protein
MQAELHDLLVVNEISTLIGYAIGSIGGGAGISAVNPEGWT